MAEVSSIRNILKRALYLLPVILVIAISYLYYLEKTKQRVSDTKKDIVFLTKNLSLFYDRPNYKNFDSDFVSYSNYIPKSLKIQQATDRNEIINRFGGKMIFKESPLTLEERQNYLYMIRDRKAYEASDNGLKAFTVLFTELETQECVRLAIIEWEKISPRYMGIEASHLSPKHPFNGLEKLDYYVLENYDENNYKGHDEGFVTRTHFTTMKAVKACACLRNNCTIALKFK